MLPSSPSVRVHAGRSIAGERERERARAGKDREVKERRIPTFPAAVQLVMSLIARVRLVFGPGLGDLGAPRLGTWDWEETRGLLWDRSVCILRQATFQVLPFKLRFSCCRLAGIRVLTANGMP
eukprot:2966503-Rhodomonas_salina.1